MRLKLHLTIIFRDKIQIYHRSMNGLNFNCIFNLVLKCSKANGKPLNFEPSFPFSVNFWQFLNQIKSTILKQICWKMSGKFGSSPD